MFGRKNTPPPVPEQEAAVDVLRGRRLGGGAAGKPNIVDRFQDQIDARAHYVLKTALPVGVVARFCIGGERFIAAIALHSASDAADILMVHRSRGEDATTAQMLTDTNFTKNSPPA